MRLKLVMLQFLLLSVVIATGCEVMPVVRYKPTLHNPFRAELGNVAIVPFYNKTGTENIDGREFARCFANELQRVPGFHVVANHIVEETMIASGLHELESVNEIRYLGQLLNVDVVVIGKIHYFDEHYPPSVKFETEWYAVNPYHHPIPAGYGLPWGTKHEGDIPEKIVMQAEMELATAQIKTQTPHFEPVTKEQIERERRERRRPRAEEHRPSPRNPSGSQPGKEAQKPNPIRFASGSAEDDSVRQAQYYQDSAPTDPRQQEFLRRQESFFNKNLATTGIVIPPKTQDADRSGHEEDLVFDPSLPHPLHNGPLPSRWADQNQIPFAEQKQMNPGTYQGHYPGFPGHANAAWQYSPEQLAAMTPEELAQLGWIRQQVPAIAPMYASMPGMPVAGQAYMIYGEPHRFPGLPAEWPDPRGFIPEGPKPERPEGEVRSDAPVLSQTSFYEGNDSEFMQALDDYDFLFRDDKRIASKESILNVRSEFIRFCCRLHIWEMFSSRGGAGPAEKVVREWKLWNGGQRPY